MTTSVGSQPGLWRTKVSFPAGTPWTLIIEHRFSMVRLGVDVTVTDWSHKRDRCLEGGQVDAPLVGLTMLVEGIL